VPIRGQIKPLLADSRAIMFKYHCDLNLRTQNTTESDQADHHIQSADHHIQFLDGSEYTWVPHGSQLTHAARRVTGRPPQHILAEAEDT